MKSISTLLTAAPLVMASAQWDYKDSTTWPDLTLTTKDGAPEVNQCKKETGRSWNQSPIDLRMDWPSKSAGFDNFQKLYQNQVETESEKPTVRWNGHTSQTSLTETGQLEQTFQSYHAAKTYGADDRFNGAQFHFHHPSEHSVDGKFYDMEMHTVHLPVHGTKNGFIASAMGLMFSVQDFTRTMESWEQKILTDFFNSMSWGEAGDAIEVAEVPYGNLMMMVDMNNRWTYKGSVTTPPCAQNVYWNVLQTVYPISSEHFKQFRQQLHKDVTICPNVSNGITKVLPAECSPGNNRVIQDISPDHNPFIISNGADLTKTVRHQVISSDKVSAQNEGLMSTQPQPMKGMNTPQSLVATAPAESSSESLTTVITVLLIVSILFLLCAVIIVTKNSFNKPVQYQGVEQGTLTTERQNEGGEAEMI